MQYALLRPPSRTHRARQRGLGDGALARLAAARAAGPFGSVADVVQRAGWAALRAVGDTLPLAPARGADGDGDGDASDGDGHAPPAMTPHAAVVADYRAVGLSVDGHPMARYRGWCERVGALHAAGLARCRSGTQVVTAGLVIVRQKPSTAKGTVFLTAGRRARDGERDRRRAARGAVPRDGAPRGVRRRVRPGGAARS